MRAAVGISVEVMSRAVAMRELGEDPQQGEEGIQPSAFHN